MPLGEEATLQNCETGPKKGVLSLKYTALEGILQ
jgi:hypothetical protein